MQDESKTGQSGGVGSGGEMGWPTAQGMLNPKGGITLPMPWKPEMTRYLLSQLIGHPLRVSDGLVTKEIMPGRVTIIVDKANVIRDIYIDPGEVTQ